MYPSLAFLIEEYSKHKNNRRQKRGDDSLFFPRGVCDIFLWKLNKKSEFQKLKRKCEKFQNKKWGKFKESRDCSLFFFEERECFLFFLFPLRGQRLCVRACVGKLWWGEVEGDREGNFVWVQGVVERGRWVCLRWEKRCWVWECVGACVCEISKDVFGVFWLVSVSGVLISLSQKCFD